MRKYLMCFYLIVAKFRYLIFFFTLKPVNCLLNFPEVNTFSGSYQIENQFVQNAKCQNAKKLQSIKLFIAWIVRE